MKFKDVQNLTNVDVTRMSNKQLKEFANVLFPVVNKRIERLERKGLDGVPSITALKRSRGVEDTIPKFKTSSSKTRNQLLSQVIEAQGFAKDITSTIRGVKKLSRDFWNRQGYEKPPIDDKTFWEEFRKFEEADNGAKFSKAESNFAVSSVRAVWDNTALRERFLTDNDYRQGIIDDIYDYKSKLGLEPKQENITEDFKEMT